jgi:transcriptional regulator with XRE-family HTH domain
MSITAQQLGQIVRETREAQGLSRREVTEQAGIGKTALYDLEHGNPGVRWNTLIAVLDLLGLHLGLTGSASQPAPDRPEPEPVPEYLESLPDHLL